VPSGPQLCVAVFAHNVERTIGACLDSALGSEPDSSHEIHVVVNGSQDRSLQKVESFAARYANIRPAVLPLADKANAWNHYVHELAPTAAAHVFIDGDIRIAPGTLGALDRALRSAPEARAAAALPITGRDRVGWNARMQAFGRLAGGCYALTGELVSQLRALSLCIPVGLIGEDFLLTCLVKRQLNAYGLIHPSPRLVFAPGAGFSYRSLSPRRPADWLVYARRLARYQLRDHQLAMLFDDVETRREPDLPDTVATLYRRSRCVPRYRWRGAMTPFDLLAVWHIRRVAALRANDKFTVGRSDGEPRS
jgi:glycosyltransferase involved in cell wall biosynthesis